MGLPVTCPGCGKGGRISAASIELRLPKKADKGSGAPEPRRIPWGFVCENCGGHWFEFWHEYNDVVDSIRDMLDYTNGVITIREEW